MKNYEIKYEVYIDIQEEDEDKAKLKALNILYQIVPNIRDAADVSISFVE